MKAFIVLQTDDVSVCYTFDPRMIFVPFLGLILWGKQLSYSCAMSADLNVRGVETLCCVYHT